MDLDLNPADFPFGSPESRAAARALAAMKMALSQDDEDCLTLYCGCCLLTASMDPDYSALESASAYRRGEELYDSRHGPIVPAHLDDHLKRSTRESLEFELVFRREPKTGDVLTFAEMSARSRIS